MRQNTLIGAIAVFIFMANKNDRIWKKQKTSTGKKGDL